MAEHNILGKWGEEAAADLLRKKGYTVMFQNWRTGHRDIDIVAQKGSDLVVFVEVKTRKKGTFVSAEMAVDREKIRSLCFAARSFVMRYRIDCDVRFDIITVNGGPGDYDINHIEDAFRPLL